MYLDKLKICNMVEEIEFLSQEKENHFSEIEKSFFLKLYEEMVVNNSIIDNKTMKVIVVDKRLNMKDKSDISYAIYSINIIHLYEETYEKQYDNIVNIQASNNVNRVHLFTEGFYYVMPSGEIIEYIYGVFSQESNYWMPFVGKVFKEITAIKNSLLLKNKLSNSLTEKNLSKIIKTKI